jgi:hypothetical protein
MEADVKMSADCGALFKALVQFQAECGSPRKNATNPHFKSKFADLGEVLETAKPVLQKHGLALLQFPCGGSGDAVSVATMLTHESGQWLSATVCMPLEKKSPQAAGSAISYARRYSAMAALGMAADDDDGEQASGRGRDDKPRPVAKPRTLDDVAPPGGAAERPKDEPAANTQTRGVTARGSETSTTPSTGTGEPLVLYPRTGEMLPRSEVVKMHNALSTAYHKKMKLSPGQANAHGLFEPNVPMPKMPAGKHEGDPVGIVPAGYLRKVTMQDPEFLKMDPGLVLWVSYAAIEHELERPVSEAAE